MIIVIILTSHDITTNYIPAAHNAIMSEIMSDTGTEKTLLLSRSEAPKSSPASSQYTSCSDDEVVRRKPTVEDMLDRSDPRIHDDSENDDEEVREGQYRNEEYAQCALSRRCCLPCTRFIQSHSE